MNRSHLQTFFGLICLLVSFVASPAAFLKQETAPFIGTWNGHIEVAGEQIEIITKFSVNDEGNLQGTIDVPARSAVGLALSNFKIEEKKIAFNIDGVSGEAAFSGDLDETGTKIAGSFSQGGVQGTFTLEKG